MRPVADSSRTQHRRRTLRLATSTCIATCGMGGGVRTQRGGGRILMPGASFR